MNKNDYTVVTWNDDIQHLMEIDGFKENSCLINDEPLLSQYGSSAYFVRKSWLSAVTDTHIPTLQSAIISARACSGENAPNLAILHSSNVLKMRNEFLSNVSHNGYNTHKDIIIVLQYMQQFITDEPLIYGSSAYFVRK